MTSMLKPPGTNEADSVRPLGRQEFEELRQLARRSFGLDLKPGKEELVRARLRQLMRCGNFDSYRDYCRHVVEDSTGEALAAMIDALATNHTSFLREPDHFDFLRQSIVPMLAERESVEIWSAACSTGEEVWTLACLLQEVLPSKKIRIHATDISRKALKFAASACYPAERCQAVPKAWLSRYFTPVPGAQNSYRVAAPIRETASFRRLNLLEAYGWTRPFPVIFCRNVMIYFDKPTQERVVRQLTDCLEPGGYLLVGHAESLTRVAHSLDYVRPAIYCKPGRKPERRQGPWSRS